MTDKLIAKRTVFDENWKTAYAQHAGPIPEGAEVTYKGTYMNYYGSFIKVDYNGRIYYAYARDFYEKPETDLETNP